VNYPTYDQPTAQTVVIEDGLAQPADVDDVAALDLADVRSVRDDATRAPYTLDDIEAAANDLQIAALSLFAAEKAFTDRGLSEFATAAAGLRASTAFLLHTVRG
jgi:hypothetical protein